MMGVSRVTLPSSTIFINKVEVKAFVTEPSLHTDVSNVEFCELPSAASAPVPICAL